jgi:hypothetical protein
MCEAWSTEQFFKEENVSNSKMYFGGVPTEPDVRRLLNKYGCPQQGQVMNYEEVATVIGIRKQDSRFKTVTNAWRKAIYSSYNIVIGTRPGVGFVALQEPERLDYGSRKFRHGIRQIKRSHGVISGCDEMKLTPEQRGHKQHDEMVSAHLILAGRLEARRLQSSNKK